MNEEEEHRKAVEKAIEEFVAKHGNEYSPSCPCCAKRLRRDMVDAAITAGVLYAGKHRA